MLHQCVLQSSRLHAHHSTNVQNAALSAARSPHAHVVPILPLLHLLHLPDPPELEVLVACTGANDVAPRTERTPEHAGVVRVADLSSLDPDALVGWGGGMGSPEVSVERLLGEEHVISLLRLSAHC